MLQAVFLHELGHMMGLGHVNDPAQLMYPVATTRTAYGTGDLEGLYHLGTPAGCLGSGFFTSATPGATLDGAAGDPPLIHASVADSGN
jgi:hypothetical protein